MRLWNCHPSYQGLLSPELVSGRDALLADLAERVSERRVTTLLGPRRYGKTSVLRRLATDLSEVANVWVDLHAVVSVADVAVRFDEAIVRPVTPSALWCARWPLACH